MNLIKCPYCGKETNAERGFCSYCNEALNTTPSYSQPTKATTGAEIIKAGTIFFGISIVALSICLLVSIIKNFSGDTPVEELAAKTTSLQYFNYSIYAFISMIISYVVKAIGVLIEKVELSNKIATK